MTQAVGLLFTLLHRPHPLILLFDSREVAYPYLMATPSIPDPTAITFNTFEKFFSLYEEIVQAVYQSKIKDSRKLTQALDDDTWRYIGLSQKLKKHKSDSGKIASLSKEELERLVRWKM